MTTTVYERAVELMEAELADELLALDPQGGKCFGFNSVATAIWRHLQVPQSIEQLTDQLLADYDVTPEECRKDLQEHLDDLVANGLLRQRPEP